jgi:putative FmdB family regulatory protein
MPRYNYYCDECDDYFELSHSMTELLEDCIVCSSSEFTRVPSIPTYIEKVKQKADRKTGSFVEEYIEKNKKSIQEEKKRLKGQEYKG